MCPQRTPGANPRPTRARQLAGALILIALAARPAAAVIGLVEANGKAVTTLTRCKRSARSLTLPIQFLSESRWQASLGAVTPSGTYDAAATRRSTTISFTLDDNARWSAATRPILEAFFHARFFLEMAVRYAALDAPPTSLPR